MNSMIEPLEGRMLLCGGNSDVFNLAVPNTSVSEFSVEITRPAGRCSSGVNVITNTNGVLNTRKLTRLPAKFNIVAPEVPGLHTFNVTIGDRLNTFVNIDMADNSSNTITVSSSGADVKVIGGDNASNTITVSTTESYSRWECFELPIEILGGENALNQISLEGSGLVVGGFNASNHLNAVGGDVVYVGDEGANFVSVAGNGTHILLGGDNALNDFDIGGGCNYVVGGDNASNTYRVADAGRGVIVYGENALNLVLVQSSQSLKDYFVVTDPNVFHCGGRDYGDGDDGHCD